MQIQFAKFVRPSLIVANQTAIECSLLPRLGLPRAASLCDSDALRLLRWTDFAEREDPDEAARVAHVRYELEAARPRHRARGRSARNKAGARGTQSTPSAAI